MRFEFVIRSGREAGHALSLTTGRMVTFGRLKACDVQLDDEAVSRRHCTLQAEEDHCVVADLQSANGTFVNDVRVTTAHLQPGDMLRIGQTELQFVSAFTPAPPLAGIVTTTSLRLTDVRGKTLVRRAVDPHKLEFLSQIAQRRDEHALLQSTQRYLTTLHNVSDLLSRASGVEGLFDSIVSAILDVTGGDRAAILLREAADSADPALGVVAVRARAGAGAKVKGMSLSRTVVRDVLEHGISTFTHDALTDQRYGAGDSVVRQQIRSVMCAPMRTTDEILGVLYVDSHSTHEFSEAHVELLAAIGNQAGIALHRARLVAEVEKMFLDVMKVMAAIIDAKDGYTHRHSERVAALGVKLARELGLSSDDCATVELSGLLHDVGKIGVPDAILNKPGQLTDDEFAEMRRHPDHGATILSNIQSARISRLLPGVKCHHERWDGSGYPEGLKEDDIPLLGRILAVADVLDALASDRSYRTALSLDAAVIMIQEQAGRAFDPLVVAAAVALHARGELAVPFTPGPALQ